MGVEIHAAFFKIFQNFMRIYSSQPNLCAEHRALGSPIDASPDTREPARPRPAASASPRQLQYLFTAE